MDASFFVALINLLFVPLVPVYVYYKKNARPLTPSLEMLFHYGLAAAFLVPLTKAVAFLPGRILKSHIDLDSGYYTIAALIAAWALPFLADIFQNVSIKIELVKDEDPSDESPEQAG